MKTVAQTVGRLDHSTDIIAFYGMEQLFKPVIVFPVCELHNRILGNDKKTPMDCLPHSYFYHRDKAGVDNPILGLGQELFE